MIEYHFDGSIQVTVPEHMVCVSFVNDDDAELFRDWLDREGMAAFLAAVAVPE